MELTLGLSLAHEPRTVSEFLREVSATPDRDEKMSKLDKYVKNLTDEMRKIDPFKRELPLCVLLLNDAIERLKAEQLQCQKSEDRPVIEEFFPLKRNCEGDEDRDCCEREKWMSSAEPWINNSARDQKPMSVEEDHSAKERNPIQPRNYRNGGGGLFVPFWGQSCVRGAPLEKDNDRLRVSEFTLLSPTSELPSSGTTTKNLAAYRSSNLTEQMKLQKKPQKQLQQQQQQQALRKQRRCWSPELHRRFVEALEQLGGSQVATPKQIRELMDVEGLTNDEVKSHLQKYRLHIRRVPSPSAAHEDGLSLSRETGMDCSKLKGTKSESPQGPLLGTGGSAKGASSAGCESMEMTDEEDNSEAHSWITGLGERVTAP